MTLAWLHGQIGESVPAGGIWTSACINKLCQRTAGVQVTEGVEFPVCPLCGEPTYFNLAIRDKESRSS